MSLPSRGDAAIRDLALAENDPWDIGEIIVGHLASKGFCVIDTGLDGDLLGKAAKEAEEIDEAGRLRRTSDLIAEGLLGAAGSARIAQLSQEGDAEFLGEGLRKADEALSSIAAHIEPHLQETLGFDSRSRTHATLHESVSGSAVAVGSAPDLSEAEASDWLFQFIRGAILCVVAIGPEAGTLELRPFDEEAEVYKLKLAPGNMVVLRSAAVVARFSSSSGRTLLLSSFLITCAVRPDKHEINPDLTPFARQLNDWATERLDKLKEQERADDKLNVPREWIVAMNRQTFKGQYMAARGMALRAPATWNEQEFFAASFGGPDYVIEVPLMRWDHSQNYHPNPEAWRMSLTCTKHFSMIDGCELFDCRAFALSPAESKGMDPHQRIVLENGYEALVKGGYKKGQIMNSTGGMYLGFGTGTSDYNFMPRESEGGATGGSAAITSNRFSFCMGMRGPSISIDAEDASGLVAVHLGCEGLQRRGRLTTNAFSLVGGVKVNLSAHYWPLRQAAGQFSEKGRCLAFDATADGMVLADNATNIVLNAMTEVVDEMILVKEYEELIGVVAGSSTNHNGRSASFNAPNGPAEQEVLGNTLRAAGLSGFDMDAFECYCYGGYLTDAVEASSAMRILRLADQSEQTLGLTSLKSSLGSSHWSSGAAALARVILGHHWGCMTPNIHLRQVNPHIDAFDQPMNFVGEAVEFGMRSSYTQTMSRGFGGTNCSVIAFGSMNPELRKPPPKPGLERERLIFWPGGGGKLDPVAAPRKGFHISGTFTNWDPEPMELERQGVYAYTFTLGESRWEQFQIWTDGDPRKCLYPELPKAPKQTAVCGPSSTCGGNAWHIEGRTQKTEQYVEERPALPAIHDVGAAEGAEEAVVSAAATSGGMRTVEVGTVDRGFIGAKYRIRFHIAGKYRLVDWQRLSGKPEDDELPAALEALQSLPRSGYFVTGDFNGWGFSEMVREPGADGAPVRFAFDVQLMRPGGEFQILRNRDWDQAIYPLQEMSGCEDPSAVGGPDDEGYGRAWYLDGQPGDRFRIELRIAINTGRGEREVSWTALAKQALTEVQLQEASVPRFAVFGSWDGGARLRGLSWNGSYHHFYVQLGDDARVNFQLVRDFSWDRIFHPSVPDAHPGVDHFVRGPSPGDGRTRGLNWTIGLKGTEMAGEVYEVRAFHEGKPLGATISRVEWSRVESGSDLSAADAEGLVLRARRRR